VSQQGVLKRRTSPVTQLVTSATADELAEDGPYRSFSGTVAGVEPGQKISPEEWNRAVARHLQTVSRANTRVLRRERFQALWRHLDEAGIFQLPPYRGAGRPTDEPHFILKTPHREWTFTRPAYVDTPDRNDPQVAQLRTWNTVKLAFFDFLKQPE
jgi:hypothetical protein